MLRDPALAEETSSSDEGAAPEKTVFSSTSRAVVYGTQLFDTVGLTTFVALYPYYFTHLQGYSKSLDGLLYGLISSSFAFGRLIGNIGLGVASDKFGRRPIALLATFVTAGFAIWTAYAPSIWQLSAARFFAGIAAGTSGVLQSYVADITSLEDRAKEMGRIGAASSIGLLLGPSLGILFGYTLGVNLGFFVCALVGAGIGALNFAGVFFFLQESPRFAIMDRSQLKARKICPKWSKFDRPTIRSLGAIFAVTFFGAYAFILLETIMPLLLIQAWEYEPWMLIIIYGAFMVGAVLLQLLVFARIINVISDIRNYVSFVSLVSGCLIFALPIVNNFYYQLFIILAGGVCITLGPALTVMATFLSGGRHGTILGFRTSIASLARAVSPLINGPAYDVVFPSIYPSGTTHILPFLICSIMMLVAALVIRISDKSFVVKSEVTEEINEKTKLIQ